MSPSTAFKEWTSRLEALAAQPRQPASETGLRRAELLLDMIGNPHRAYRAVHVTGSSGKGSTTAMIASILRAAGFRTGTLRSPHLASYTERMAVDGEDIGEEIWCRQFASVWPVVEAMTEGRLPGYELGRPSFSEVLFAVASLWFREAKVEWAALEVGMGGRLDATNLVDADVAVITNVSLEHTQILGDTIAKIAAEKAAIIKPGSVAVTASQNQEALDVVTEQSLRVGAELVRVPRDVRPTRRSQSIGASCWTFETRGRRYDVHLPVSGRFQGDNAAAALAATLGLRRRGIAIEDDALVRGLETVSIPGRLEVVQRDPLVILDGAHNPDAAHCLRGALEELLPDRRIVLLFAALKDKDVESMAAALAPLASMVFVTRAPGTSRAIPPRRLASYFLNAGCKAVPIEDTDVAFGTALSAARQRGALAVCGSLYLVGYVRESIAARGVRA